MDQTTLLSRLAEVGRQGGVLEFECPFQGTRQLTGWQMQAECTPLCQGHSAALDSRKGLGLQVPPSPAQLCSMPSQAPKAAKRHAQTGNEVSQTASPARRQSQPTSSTGTLKATSSLCSVGAAKLLLQLRMKRRGGGLSLG